MLALGNLVQVPHSPPHLLDEVTSFGAAPVLSHDLKPVSELII